MKRLLAFLFIAGVLTITAYQGGFATPSEPLHEAVAALPAAAAPAASVGAGTPAYDPAAPRVTAPLPPRELATSPDPPLCPADRCAPRCVSRSWNGDYWECSKWRCVSHPGCELD